MSSNSIALRLSGMFTLVALLVFLLIGWALYQQVDKGLGLLPEAELVVLTNYATPDMRRRCAQLGAHRVFDKSAELEELLAYCAKLAADAAAH